MRTKEEVLKETDFWLDDTGDIISIYAAMDIYAGEATKELQQQVRQQQQVIADLQRQLSDEQASAEFWMKKAKELEHRLSVGVLATMENIPEVREAAHEIADETLKSENAHLRELLGRAVNGLKFNKVDLEVKDLIIEIDEALKPKE